MSLYRICAQTATVSPWRRTTCGGFQLERSTAVGGAQSAEKIVNGESPDRLLVVQTGDSAGQVKVFKAHAVPQGLCENLINAPKLLADHQKDGDSPIQSIVSCERSRTEIVKDLRNFIKVDNHCALEWVI